MIAELKPIVFEGIELEVPQPNDLAYLEIPNWRTFRPMADRILIDWEEKKGELLNGLLVTPDTHRKMHYTGIVLAVGPEVDPEIKPGMRLLFAQFSGFEKLWHPEIGRMALISESSQDSGFAIIPHRTTINNGQGDYDYEK